MSDERTGRGSGGAADADADADAGGVVDRVAEHDEALAEAVARAIDRGTADPEGRVAELETEVELREERIEALETELELADERVEELEARLEELDPERVESLRERLDEREEEIEDLRARLKRKQADFQNFKKRAEKKRERIQERATEDLVERILGVRDNLRRAIENDHPDVESLKEGLEMTLREFDRVLESEDVSEIDPEPGGEVDPQRHEVMMQVDSDRPEGAIVEVYRPGYEMAGEVVRTAQVTVSTGAGAGTGTGDADAETEEPDADGSAAPQEAEGDTSD
jgi:molecular chaperone GrpE